MRGHALKLTCFMLLALGLTAAPSALAAPGHPPLVWIGAGAALLLLAAAAWPASRSRRRRR